MRNRIGLFGLAAMTLMACNKPSDYDEDGYAADVDCNDNDASIHPDALEICDGIDNNCDDSIDGEDADEAATYYADLDGDTYGGETLSVTQCDMPEGYVDNADDCDDDSADINPDAAEICDGLDNDCDALTDDEDDSVDGAGFATYYSDADGDGYGKANISKDACDAPSGYVDNGEDCDDTDATVNPESVWYSDMDSDGFGTADFTMQACEQPSGYSANMTDCIDTDANVYPGAAISEPTLCTVDSDGDGWGDSAATSPLDAGTDCDDSDAALNQDDADQDTYSSCNADCDDNDGYAYPGAAASEPTLCTWDLDMDGYGDNSAEAPLDAGTDCDDSSSTTYPGAAYNDSTDACMRDDDGDGWGGAGGTECFTLGMYDSGSFWDDASLDVYIDTTLHGSYENTLGSWQYESNVCVTGLNVEFYYDCNSTYDCPNASIEIQDANGNVLYEDGDMVDSLEPDTGLIYSYEIGGSDCDDADASLNADDADGDGCSTCEGDTDDNDNTVTCN